MAKPQGIEFPGLKVTIEIDAYRTNKIDLKKNYNLFLKKSLNTLINSSSKQRTIH